MTIKALTILQPYAYLIAIGEKWVENRTWPLPDYHHGPLAIHAGKSLRLLVPPVPQAYRGVLDFGCIVAVAGRVWCCDLLTVAQEILDGRAGHRCKGPGTPSWREIVTHPHAEGGPYYWILEDVVPVHPVQYCRGAQGLWNVELAQ